MTNYDQARQNMISGQILPHRIACPKLIKAMSILPREKFVSQLQTSLCYGDQTIEVFKNRYLLAPMIFAKLLQEANIQEDDVVLDIGFGTGYSSIVLSFLARHVTGLETHSSLITRLQQLATNFNVTNIDAVSGPLDKGWQKQAPYDVIMIEGAMHHLPTPLLDQLKEGGRLVLMKKKAGVDFCQVTIVTKRENSWTTIHPFEAAAPILEDFQRPCEFQL